MLCDTLASRFGTFFTLSPSVPSILCLMSALMESVLLKDKSEWSFQRVLEMLKISGPFSVLKWLSTLLFLGNVAWFLSKALSRGLAHGLGGGGS